MLNIRFEYAKNCPDEPSTYSTLSNHSENRTIPRVWWDRKRIKPGQTINMSVTEIEEQ